MSIIMHIDVNNAFLSWEAIYLLNHGCKYDIRNSYAVIGGNEKERRGIVLAKSNAAKRLGIVTAEPLFQARKKCKVLRVYPPHYHYYLEMSNKMMNLIKKYTPNVEVASIDECYLDYSDMIDQYGDPLNFAKKLQLEIKETLDFTVNVGIANNKLCAKMASDLSKPFKIHTIFDDEIKDKMYPLPVEELFGIGRKTAPKLRNLGIKTIGELADYNELELTRYFKNQATRMIYSAKGIDDSKVICEPPEAKGISRSTTLAKDLENKNDIYQIIKKITEPLTLELNESSKYAYVITVFLKNNEFKVTSHQRKLRNPTNNLKIILDTCKELLEEMWKEERIRLVGVRFDRLVDKANIQLSLFDINTKDHELYEIVNDLKNKYGEHIIK